MAGKMGSRAITRNRAVVQRCVRLGFPSWQRVLSTCFLLSLEKKWTGTSRSCQTPSAIYWPVISLTCYSGHIKCNGPFEAKRKLSTLYRPSKLVSCPFNWTKHGNSAQFRTDFMVFPINISMAGILSLRF